MKVRRYLSFNIGVYFMITPKNFLKDRLCMAH
jgi:hypothetical protein